MKKKIFVRAPVLSQSGYGEQSRFALRALRSREDIFDIYVQPIPWGQTGWVWEDSEFRRWLDAKIAETQIAINQKTLQPEISLQITIPNEFQKICPINIGYTAGIETTKVATNWVAKGAEMNKILVVSNHAKNTYVGTTVQAQNQQTGETVAYNLETPVEVVWENTIRAEPEKIDQLELDYDFNFLMVSQFSPRKNFVNSLKWWVEEFIDQEVGLVVKTNMTGNSRGDLEVTSDLLNNIMSNYPDRKCKVYLLHGDLSSGQMTWLYGHDKIKSLINIAHGEGFGLPMFEAAREGMPVITIGWSGQVDFLCHNGKDYFESVEFTLQPVQNEAVWKGVIEPDSMWAFAEQGSYKMSLRRAYKNIEKLEERSLELKEIIDSKFSDEVLFKLFVDNVLGFDSSMIEEKEEEELEFE